MRYHRTVSPLVQLVRRAAEGDGTAWEHLVRHYQEFAAAIHEATKTNDDEPLEDPPGPGPETGEILRAAERTQNASNAVASLPLRWQQLLQLLVPDPPAQDPRQQGK